jgi:hypothetical protein
MVDHEVDRDQRVDFLCLAAEVLHRVAHRGKIDHRRHAGEILHQHARRPERDIAVGGLGLEPSREALDVFLADRSAVLVAQQIFQQHLHRERQPGDAFEAVLLRHRQAEIGVSFAPDLEGPGASEAVERRHDECFHPRRGAAERFEAKLLPEQVFRPSAAGWVQ